MSKNPYSAGRLVVYALIAVVMGLGAAGAFGSCEDNQWNPAPERPMQSGRQGS